MNNKNIFKKTLAAFSAAAVGATCVSFSASALQLDPVKAPPYKAVMSFQAGADQIWEEGETNVATIDGDGTYELSYTFAEGSATVEACIIDTDISAYDFAPADCEDPIAEGSVTMKIDAITLTRADGTEEAIAYNGPSDGAFRTGDNGNCYRYNILNNWTTPKVADIDAALPGEGTVAGDTVTVKFTIAGLGDSPFNKIPYGDVDGDGVIALSDASTVLTEYAKLAAGMESTFTDAQNAAGDVDGDGVISLTDASKILSYYAATAAGLNPSIEDFFDAAK